MLCMGLAMQVDIIHVTASGACIKAQCVVKQGTTVQQAVQASAIFDKVARDKIAAVGICGQKVEWTARVRDGDRIELYRRLSCDPKQMRRQRL